MKLVWKVLLGLAVVVPLGAYVAGSLAASASSDPTPRQTIEIRQVDPTPTSTSAPTTKPTPTPTPTSSPTSSPTGDEDDDGDDGPGDDDVEVVTPWEDLDDHSGHGRDGDDDDHSGHGGGGHDDRSGHGGGED